MSISETDHDFDPRVIENIRYHANRLARRQAVPGMLVEDYEQDLLLDLLNRKQSYDVRRSSFRTFADRVVRHRASTRLAPTQRVTAERNFISMDVPVDEGECTLGQLLVDDVPPLDEACAIRVDVGRFVANLPTSLLECCNVLLHDNIAAGARARGIDRTTVYDRLIRVRRQAAAQGLAIYVTNSDTFAVSPVSGPQVDLNCGADAVDVRCRNVRLLVTEIEVRRWLGRAKPGESLEYHRGHLALDILPCAGWLPEPDRLELSRVAQCARNAGQRAYAHLVQVRYGTGDYGYRLLARPSRSTTGS